jgi:sirohydrochlorin cobaltochelatase
MRPTGYIGRKMRLPELKDKPAIVIAAFGSTRRGKAALDLFDKKVRERYSEHEIFWAYTSEFIRKKSGLPSLHQTLASIESAGYRKAVVVPLHIFPGVEYQEVSEIIEYFPGLRILLSETLMHRWIFVKEVLAVVEKDFLPSADGLNLLALHGTPLAADPANTAYLGLEKLVSDKYGNVLAASLEGVPDHEAVLARIARQNLSDRYKRIRIIPLMYLAGLHVEDDLMGEADSWLRLLEDMGFKVDCQVITHDKQQFFKSLAFYPEIVDFFLSRLERSLELIRSY